MFTLGYNFKPWEGEKAVADGESIWNYIHETAEENGILEQIRYNHWVTRADWSSEDACWTIEAKRKNGRKTRFTCNFLLMCSGYYRYEHGYTPDFPGRERFQGTVIHPQHWPEDFDYTGKRIVVIGSGATSMTLIPSLTDRAEHVTMLQRSPTYVVAMPDRDSIADALRKYLPKRLAYFLTRMKNVSLAMLMYEVSRRRPKLVRKLIRAQLKSWLGDRIDIDTHFRPSYNPWDQRLCLVPNGDLFKSLRKGTASVVTDHIETFTENGILLQSGQELEADVIVTATGLDVVILGDAQFTVDGEPMDPAEHYSYKGMMLNDVPNMVQVIGYTNASWTLKADLTAEYSCRLLNYMDEQGYDICMAHKEAEDENAGPLLDLNAGYVLRALDKLPKQGEKTPWRVYQNYAVDLVKMRFSPVNDRAMQFYRAGEIRIEHDRSETEERIAS
jgi:cation diffusion facilitator CzcD-associated flavoprotein CzcO